MQLPYTYKFLRSSLSVTSFSPSRRKIISVSRKNLINFFLKYGLCPKKLTTHEFEDGGGGEAAAPPARTLMILSTHLLIFLPTYLSTYQHFHLFTHLPIYQLTNPLIQLTYLFSILPSILYQSTNTLKNWCNHLRPYHQTNPLAQQLKFLPINAPTKSLNYAKPLTDKHST